MPWLDRQDVRLNFEDSGPPTGNGASGGKGAPILLSHGFGASCEMWQGQVDAFSGQHRIIRWDMRGHGKTECPDDPGLFSHEHCVADMAALLDHLEIDQAIIGGHSLGGFMSLAFNVRHPRRVKALYLQACGPGYRSEKARAGWNARAEERAHDIEKGGLDAIAHGAEVGASIRGTAQGLANAARNILAQVDAQVIDSLPNIAVPVLIVVGAEDVNFLDGTAYMESRIPGATRVVVPGAGHGVNIEQPEMVNDALADFFAIMFSSKLS